MVPKLPENSPPTKSLFDRLSKEDLVELAIELRPNSVEDLKASLELAGNPKVANAKSVSFLIMLGKMEAQSIINLYALRDSMQENMLKDAAEIRRRLSIVLELETRSIQPVQVTRDQYGCFLHPSLPDTDGWTYERFASWAKRRSIEIQWLRPGIEIDGEDYSNLIGYEPLLPGPDWFVLCIWANEENEVRALIAKGL